MICPNCTDRNLESLKTSSGDMLSCPECATYFVRIDVLAQLSSDKEKFLQAVQETQSLRLPTHRICPQCGAAFQQGRVRSAGVVLTLCGACHALWTDFETLERLDPTVAYSLRAYLESPTLPIGPAQRPAPAPFTPPALERTSAPPPSLLDLDTTFKRTPAPDSEWQTKYAELLKRYESLEKELRGEWEKRETEMTQRQSADIQKAQEALHQSLEQKLTAAQVEADKRLEAFKTHAADVEQKRLALEAEIKALKTRVESMDSERVKLSERQVQREEDLKRQYADDLKKYQGLLKDLEKARVHQDKVLQDYRDRLDAAARKPAPVVEPIKPPVTQPTEPVRAAPKPAPVVEPKKPAGPSFWTGLFKSFKAAWSPPTTPRSASTAAPAVLAEKPVPAPAPVVQAAPVQKTDPKKGKVFDTVVGWAPRVTPFLVFLLVKAATYEGDTLTAFAWAMLTWSVCTGIRLKRMYPSKNFTPHRVAELASLQPVSRWRGVPVLLKGQLTTAPPSKELNLSDASGSFPLDRPGKLEWISHLFGLTLATQYPSGELVIKGWLRRGSVLFVEVGEARNEKTQRGSLVKALRWTIAGAVLLLAVVMLFAGDPGY